MILMLTCKYYGALNIFVSIIYTNDEEDNFPICCIRLLIANINLN